MELQPGCTLKLTQDRGKGSATGWLVWPVALDLCRYLISKPDWIRNKSVLELGAGTGAVGIACGYIGAREVAITDRWDSLPICISNVEANHQLLNSLSLVGVFELEWGNTKHLTEIKSTTGSFDLIIGSDIVYHQSEGILTALVGTITSASNGDTTVLIAYEDREGMIDDEEFFFAPMRTRFGSMECVDLGADRTLFVFTGFITS